MKITIEIDLSVSEIIELKKAEQSFEWGIKSALMKVEEDFRFNPHRDRAEPKEGMDEYEKSPKKGWMNTKRESKST